MNNNRLARLTFYKPRTVDEALALKEKFTKDSLFLAGGTDLIPMLKRRNVACGHVIGIKKIPELEKISFDAEAGLIIGAAVTLRELIDYPPVSKFYPILAQAAGAVAYNQIRNMATVIGNICVDSKCTFFNQSKLWWQSRVDCFKRGGDRCYIVKKGQQCHALSPGDTVSALIALDADLVVAGPHATRRMPLEAFYTGDGRRPHHLEDNELVTSVRIPPLAAGWRQGFLKKSARGSVDFAIAAMSIRLKSSGHAVEDIRIVLNGISTKPVRAPKTERHLIAKGINAETLAESSGLLLKESSPLSSIGAAVSVRRKMISAVYEDLVGEITGYIQPPKN